MIILGIDPGLASTGWGVVDAINQRYRPVSFGVINTKAEANLPDRIYTITNECKKLVEKYKVEAVSIEEIFFTKNISSAISVAKVIGAISYAFSEYKLPISYFSPPQIKTAVTGVGNADKNQVQQMVKILLGLDKIPKPDHAADALADCITYAVFNASMSMIRRV